MQYGLRELLDETEYIAKEIQHFYTYHPSISKSRQVVHVFRAKDLVEGKSNHDGTEDIMRLEIVSVEQLKHLIKVRKIESARTLIAYLVCCTGIIIDLNVNSILVCKLKVNRARPSGVILRSSSILS